MKTKHPFKWRHFEGSLILLCVRWYVRRLAFQASCLRQTAFRRCLHCRYGLSYRNLAEMMLDRGLNVAHTTIYRWVQRYAPEIDQRVGHT